MYTSLDGETHARWSAVVGAHNGHQEAAEGPLVAFEMESEERSPWDRIPYPSARPFPCPSLSLPPRFPLHAWAKVSWHDTPTGAKRRRRLRKCHRAPGTGTHVGGGTPYYFKPRAMRPGRVPTRREQPGIDGGTQYHSHAERERIAFVELSPFAKGGARYRFLRAS